MAGHVRAGVAEELLDHMLGDAGVDQPRSERYLYSILKNAW